MELTGLRAIVNNNGGNFTDNTGTQSNSKTLGYKLVKNASLPNLLDGFFPQQSFTNTQNPGLAAKTPSLIDPNGFGGSNFLQPVSVPHIDWSDGVQSSMAVGQTKALTESFGNGNAIDLNKSNLMLSKQINNGLISRTNSGKAGQGVGASSIGGIINNGIQFAGDAINAFSTNESGEDIANRQGTSQMSIGGVGYESQNSIDVSKEMDKVKRQNTTNTLALMGSGAALGSVIPGVGTAVGAVIGAGVGLLTGIFGGEARKKKYRRMMEELNAKINALQNSARYSAQTKAIQLLNAKEYGDSETLYLYGAKDGKLPQYNNGTPYINLATMFGTKLNNKPTYSADGQVNAEPNAKVSKGEQIVNGITKLSYRVPGKKDNKDTENAYLNPWDMVVTNKDGLSDYYAITGDYEGTKMMLKNRLEMAKNGRLPKCEEGWLGNAITSGLGAIGGLSQWWEAKNSTPRKTDSYKSNEYDLASLDILSKLGVNPFPIMLQLRNAEARSNRAIDMSGGLTSGQRTLQRLASTTNTQRAIADALANIQILNNSYKSDYAKTALSVGAANAQRAMQAYQWDEDMYAKAHAARQQGMQMGMRNILDQLNNYYANEFKRRQFNETMGLYRQDQKLRADEVQAIINNLNNKPSTYEKVSAATSISPTYMKSYGLTGNTNLASKSRLKNPELFWGKDYSLKAPALPTSYAAYKYLKPYI